MKYRILVVMAILVLVTSYELRAEERALRYDLGKIIVTATKTETYQAEVGSASTIISEEEILKSGKTSAFEVLKDTPGIAVAQNGPFGGLASVYLRGSKPGHTLFMIDGIELNDPMSTDRSFNPAHLTIDNIERIEVIRGPQSTLYGSDAMAGVVNIITKKGEGKPRFEVTSQVGSCNTSRESLWFGGSTKVIDYSLAFSEMNSRGISKARYGSDPDGYDNTTISSRFGWQMYDEAKLNLYLHFTDTQTDLDDDAFEDDPNYTMWDRQFASKIEFLQMLQSWWDHKFSFSYSDITRKFRDEKDPIDKTEDVQSWYKGDVKKFEWQNNFPVFDWSTITAGFEFERERGSSYYRSRTS
ncbi:MAG: TonB-dependent receptor, partial [Candidatus Omnitrophica bacterium]|nr:TonB-dependent receptor [Candidatus Omnitrophota bacterium]